MPQDELENLEENETGEEGSVITTTVSDGDTKEKIHISVSNLIAKNTNHSSIVRFNSNYRAIFDFDLNSGNNNLTWGAADKQAKFVWTAPDGEEETAVKDILFDRYTKEYYCDVPIVKNGAECMLIGAIGTSATAHEVIQDKYLIDKGLVDGVEWTATHYFPTQEGICNYITNNNVMGVYIRLPRIESSHDTLSIKLSSEIDVSQYDTLYYHVTDYKAPYYDNYGNTSIQMLVNEQSTSLTTGLHKIDITGDTISIEILTAGEYGYLPSTGEDYESYIFFDKMWLTKENVEEEEEEEEDSSLKNLYTTTSAFVMCVQSIHEVGNLTLGVTDNGASTIDIDDTENAGVRITNDGYLVLNCNQTTPGSGAPGESRPLMTNGEVLTYGVGKVIPKEINSELDNNNNTLINFVYDLAPWGEEHGEIIRGPGINNISFDSTTGQLIIDYSDGQQCVTDPIVGPAPNFTASASALPVGSTPTATATHAPDDPINYTLNFGIPIPKSITSATVNNNYQLVIDYNDNTQYFSNPIRGDTGNGISSISKTGSSLLRDEYTITYTDGDTFNYYLNNGRGISSIALSNTVGLEDTYTITYNDNTTSNYTIINGSNGITPSFSIGSVEALSTGTATASITGTTENLVLNLGLPKGDTGAQGPIGITPSISVGSVYTGAAGSSAAVILDPSSTDLSPIFNFYIPQGTKGETGDLGPVAAFSIGSVVALDTGNASATITGTSAAPVLNLGLPKGNTGSVGPAAGFGSVQAHTVIDGGNPSIEVLTSGPDTAKNIDFYFKNIGGLAPSYSFTVSSGVFTVDTI